MNVLIAPDSFKGSIDALSAAQAIERGILTVDESINTYLLPMADGGEGTMINLVQATKGSVFEVDSIDPISRPIQSHYGITGGGQTAIIELATSSGIDLLRLEELNPLHTTTYGTGLLIKDAINKGIKHIIVCLGGSATNDAGIGLLQALGYQFLDENGSDIPLGAEFIHKIVSIDESKVIPNLFDVKFEIACDVTNPFVGKEGASYVFGPQKGATPEIVERLDQSFTHFAEVIKTFKGKKISNIEGSGAAGGTAGGMLAFLNAELKRGIEFVVDFVNFKDILKNYEIDLIITGEGKIDGQTSSGKVISGIAQIAKSYNIPVIAIGGTVESPLSELYEQGLTSAFSIANGPMTLEEAMNNGDKLIEQQTEQIFRTLTSKQ